MGRLAPFTSNPPLFNPLQDFPLLALCVVSQRQRGEPRLGKSMPTIPFLSGCARMMLGRSFWGMWGGGVEHWTPTNARPTWWS